MHLLVAALDQETIGSFKEETNTGKYVIIDC